MRIDLKNKKLLVVFVIILIFFLIFIIFNKYKNSELNYNSPIVNQNSKEITAKIILKVTRIMMV